MATNRKTEHLRFRYGICLNDNCPKCKNKDVQQIPARKDFVCEECGKALRECPPPKKGTNKLIIIIIAAIVIIGAAIGIIFGMSGNDNSEKKVDSGDSTAVTTDTVATSQKADADTVLVEKTDTIVKTDTITRVDVLTRVDTVKVEKIVEKETTPTARKTTTTTTTTSKSSGNTSGTLKLSYGTYTGAIKNGYPHGIGRLTYSTSRVINKYDTKKRTASAGDYVSGEFVNGYFINGKHYSPDGEVIEVLMIGVPASLGYDNK